MIQQAREAIPVLVSIRLHRGSGVDLDFLPASPDKRSKVFQSQSSLYAEWRLRSGAVTVLREDLDVPPERLLQAVWWHQRVRRGELRTTDGRRLQVLHPGFWNREPGPDFRGAVLRFGEDAPVSGDVEVDLQSRGWRDHHHDINPEFRKVILHVVWQADLPAEIPVLALQPFLDSPISVLGVWLGSEAAGEFPLESLGHCCSPLRVLSSAQIDQLLRQAASIRFQSKASRIQARARQAGWEQALWEELFRSLGYKQNIWPMQRLGELRPRLCAPEFGDDVRLLLARLLGVGGLLPEELSRRPKRSKDYLRELWDVWWRDRAGLEDCALPRRLWKFSGLRPSNRPERRLALAAQWLTANDLPARLEAWCARATPANGPALIESLAETLAVSEDAFWSWHWTLDSVPTPLPQPLLGAARLTDIAVNVVLPWLWIRAVEGKNEALQREMERRYFSWPAGEDNAVLRLARHRLLGDADRKVLNSAAIQQGLLQIVRDFCEHSNAVCAGCRFPELVQAWPTCLPTAAFKADGG